MLGALVEKNYSERLIYKFLHELFILRRNKYNLSENEYTLATRKILSKMKRIQSTDIVTIIKTKTQKITKRFQDRIQTENIKLDTFNRVSKMLFFLIFFYLFITYL